MLRIYAWVVDSVPSVKTTLILAGAALAGMFLIGVGMGIAGAHGPNDPIKTLTVGDVTCEQEVTPLDSLGILRYDAGLAPLTTCINIGDTYDVVPACYEDEIIIGIGNFNRDGYWDSYICEHPDNLFCQDLYQYLELRGPYLDKSPLTAEQTDLTNEMYAWFPCPPL